MYRVKSLSWRPVNRNLKARVDRHMKEISNVDQGSKLTDSDTPVVKRIKTEPSLNLTAGETLSPNTNTTHTSVSDYNSDSFSDYVNDLFSTDNEILEDITLILKVLKMKISECNLVHVLLNTMQVMP